MDLKHKAFKPLQQLKETWAAKLVLNVLRSGNSRFNKTGVMKLGIILGFMNVFNFQLKWSLPELEIKDDHDTPQKTEFY